VNKNSQKNLKTKLTTINHLHVGLF
jgi:hypothetical protein